MFNFSVLVMTMFHLRANAPNMWQHQHAPLKSRSFDFFRRFFHRFFIRSFRNRSVLLLPNQNIPFGLVWSIMKKKWNEHTAGHESLGPGVHWWSMKIEVKKSYVAGLLKNVVTTLNPMTLHLNTSTIANST